MPDDLDLALRIRADTQQARRELRSLQTSVSQTTRDVAAANLRQANAATAAARAARDLTRAQQDNARISTEVSRARLQEARAADTAARSALAVARTETQAAGARSAAARSAIQAANALDRQAAAQTRATAATQRGTRSAQQLRFVVQNTAFQIQDFAVQVTAGTNATRAAGQQLPQLLGAFGAVGAVLGVVAAVALPLAGSLFRLGEDTDDAADGSDRLADAIDRLQSLGDLIGDVEALADRYGEATVQARSLIEAQRDLARRDADRALLQLIRDLDQGLEVRAALARRVTAQEERSLQALVASAREALVIDSADLMSAISEVRSNALRELERILDPEAVAAVARAFGTSAERVLEEIAEELQRSPQALARQTERAVDDMQSSLERAADGIVQQFGLTETAARELIAAYDELRQAPDVDARAEALGRLRQALTDAGAAAEEQNDDQLEALNKFLRILFDAEEQVLALAASGGEIAPALQTAVDAAQDLTDELDRAGQALTRLQDRGQAELIRARARVEFADDPEGRRQALARAEVAERVGPLERRLRDEGFDEREIAAQTAELVNQAIAISDAEFETRQLTEQLREMERAGTSAGRETSREMRRLRRAQEEARAEAEALRTATRDALADYAAAATETRDDVAAVWESGFSRLEDALVRFVTTGKASFSDFANSVIADINRIIIRQQITGPLADGLQGVFGGTGTRVSGPPIRGGNRPPPLRPSFHEGGVPRGPGREILALVQEGEAILTSRQAAALLGNGDLSSLRRAQEIIREAARYRYHTGGVAGATAGGGVQGAARSNGQQNVSVEIQNQGAEKRAESADVFFDIDRMIIQVALRDLDEGGPMARRIQQMVPGGQL